MCGGRHWGSKQESSVWRRELAAVVVDDGRRGAAITAGGCSQSSLDNDEWPAWRQICCSSSLVSYSLLRSPSTGRCDVHWQPLQQTPLRTSTAASASALTVALKSSQPATVKWSVHHCALSVHSAHQHLTLNAAGNAAALHCLRRLTNSCGHLINKVTQYSRLKGYSRLMIGLREWASRKDLLLRCNWVNILTSQKEKKTGELN